MTIMNKQYKQALIILALLAWIAHQKNQQKG